MEILVTYAPRDRQPRIRVVTFKMDLDSIEAMDRAARKLGLSRSEFIREAILKYISEVESEAQRPRPALILRS